MPGWLGRILPHISIEGEQFFQKHVERTGMPGIRAHDRNLWPNHPPLLTIDTVDALMSAAQPPAARGVAGRCGRAPSWCASCQLLAT